MRFSERIKELRESRNLLQRQLAAKLEIDTPMYSKIERGERKAKKEQVEKLAKLFDVKIGELMTIWLADKIYDTIEGESVGLEAVNMVRDNYSKYIVGNG